MKDSRFTASLPNDPIALVITSGALDNALAAMFTALAEKHGHVAGPWLDEIEQALLTHLKGTTMEGADLEIENSKVATALDFMHERFRTFRIALNS